MTTDLVPVSRELRSDSGSLIELRSAVFRTRRGVAMVSVAATAVSGPVAGRQLCSFEMPAETSPADIEAEARYRLEIA